MIETSSTPCDWTLAPLPAVFPGRDRRAEPRRKVMWRAEADGVRCGVRDLNEGGARIILPASQALDGPITLSIRHRRGLEVSRAVKAELRAGIRVFVLKPTRAIDRVWTAPRWQGCSWVYCRAGWCGHVSGL